MALTVTPVNYYQYGNCDALSDLEGTWTGNSAGTESDFYKEGAGCLGFTLRTIGQNDITYTKTTGTWDLSGVKHLRIWFLCSTPNAINVDDPPDPANAGIQFFVGDATNTAYYKIGGKTSYPGGWYNFVVDLSRAADAGTKPTGMLCTKIGLRVNMTAAPKNVDNVWIDNLIRCDGLKCTSDTQFSLQDIFDKDNATTGAWGVIRKITGVYYLTGSLVFGDDAGTLSCDFKDTTQVVVFEDRKVNAALYDLNVVGNATGTTKFQLGELSGGAGVSGCTVRTQSFTQTPKFKITCTDGGLADARYQTKFYGCVIGDSGTIILPLTTANREVLNCSFETCGEILASTCKFENCNVISADDRGVRINTASHGVADCVFINCPHSVHCPVSIAVPFTSLQFIGTDGVSKWDVEHSVAGTLTLNWSGYEPVYIDETGGGNTVKYNYVDLTITVKDEEQQAINGASVRVSKLADDAVVYMNELTGPPNPDGVAYESINNPGLIDLRIRVRKSSEGGTRYIPMETTGQMTATGFALTVILYKDGNL